jgi:hypothetical protein
MSLVVHVELSDLVLNQAGGYHGKVAVLVHFSDVAERLGGATREGCFSTASRVRGLPKVNEVDEARLKHCFSVMIGVRRETLEAPRVSIVDSAPCGPMNPRRFLPFRSSRSGASARVVQLLAHG